jgi:hypothetical protein
MLERGQFVLRMLHVEHNFDFFRNLGTAPLARRAETTLWESLGMLKFCGTGADFCDVYTPKGRGTVPKILGMGAHF